jgi:hypothetical protein
MINFALGAQQTSKPSQAFPLLVGELNPSKHKQVRNEGVAQFPVHQVLTPHWFWHVLTDQ